jgi:hypothetical protein
MLVETAVFRSTAPICSAIDMKRLPKTSSRTGSGVSSAAPALRPPAGAASSRGPDAASSRGPDAASSRTTRTPSSSTRSEKPGSTTTVPVSSSTIAGPTTRLPGTSASRA